MASWKCGVYVVVGTIVIVLIILLNFDFLPKRRLSEELELTTKSSFKGSVTSKDTPSTVKVPTERTTAKVRLLKFNAKCSYFLRNYTETFICMMTAMFPILEHIWYALIPPRIYPNLYVGYPRIMIEQMAKLSLKLKLIKLDGAN